MLLPLSVSSPSIHFYAAACKIYVKQHTLWSCSETHTVISWIKATLVCQVFKVFHTQTTSPINLTNHSQHFPPAPASSPALASYTHPGYRRSVHTSSMSTEPLKLQMRHFIQPCTLSCWHSPSHAKSFSLSILLNLPLVLFAVSFLYSDFLPSYPAQFIPLVYQYVIAMRCMKPPL